MKMPDIFAIKHTKFLDKAARAFGWDVSVDFERPASRLPGNVHMLRGIMSDDCAVVRVYDFYPQRSDTGDMVLWFAEYHIPSLAGVFRRMVHGLRLRHTQKRILQRLQYADHNGVNLSKFGSHWTAFKR